MKRPRVRAIGYLLTLTVCVGAGFAACLGRGTAGAASDREPLDLRLLPPTVALVAYADLHRIMTSDLRRQVELLLQSLPEARDRFRSRTGVDIENDVDRVLIGVVPAGAEIGGNSDAVVLARGRFDTARIESLMQERGAQATTYRGVRLVRGDAGGPRGVVAIAFLAPDLIAAGSEALVHAAVDLRDGGDSLASNDTMAALLPDLQSNDVWAAGFGAIDRLPGGMVDRVPPINLFTVTATVGSALQGLLRVEARDERAAGGLRELLRGLLALARMHAAVRPELKSVLDGLRLDGAGTTVTLAFDVPASAFAALGTLAPSASLPAFPR